MRVSTPRINGNYLGVVIVVTGLRDEFDKHLIGRLGFTFVQSPKTKQREVGGVWQGIDRGNRQVAVVQQGLRRPVEEAAGVGGVGRSNRGREMRKQSKGNK